MFRYNAGPGGSQSLAHPVVSEFDFRQNHFDKYIFSLSVSFRKRLDDELALGVEPIVEIVAVNRAALDEVLIRTAGDSLPHILKQRRDRVGSVQSNWNGGQNVHVYPPYVVVFQPSDVGG